MSRNAIPHADLALEATYVRSCISAYRQGHLANADERLAPRDMHDGELAIVLEALHGLADAKTTVDAFTAKEAVVAQPRGSNAAMRLESVLAAGEVSKHVERMAAKLRQMAVRRRRHEVLLRALAASLDADDEQVTSLAVSLSVHETEKRQDEFLQGYEVTYQALQYFQNLDLSRSMQSGFGMIDRAISALQPQTLTVIGGTTGAGKSSLMLAMAVAQAKLGTPVCIISLEDALTVWGPRLAAHFTGINPNEIKPGMTAANVARTVAACEQIAQVAGIHFAFEIGRPLADVLRAIRHNVRRNKCRVVYVDYLQAIGWVAGRDDKRNQFISSAVSAMKATCAELDVALVLGSQLSRGDKGSEFKEPNMSSLKESGDVENMSEVIVLLWKDGDKDDSITLGKIAKVKWSAKRPRFQVERSAESGSVMDLTDAPMREAPSNGRNGFGR